MPARLADSQHSERITKGRLSHDVRQEGSARLDRVRSSSPLHLLTDAVHQKVIFAWT